MKNNSTRQKAYPLRGPGAAAILGGVLLFMMFLALRLGSSAMDHASFFNGLLKRPGAETQSTILYALRLPRMLAGLLAGIGLSVSGVLLQSVTNNALASPNIIGVNAGAGFCVMLCLTAFPTHVYVLPPAAFLGAFGTTLLIVVLSEKAGASKNTVILAGIACSALFQAGISFLSVLDPDALVSYTAFSIGGFSGVTMKKLYIPAGLILLSLLLSLFFSGKINVLCLGDNMAASLGIRVRILRILCLIFASASAAAVVSYAGLLGFVGLTVPHITRRLTGGNLMRQLIFAPLIGGILVLTADLVSRTFFAPTEIPVGIVTAAAGAPFFLALLLRRKEPADA
ncbi:MAG: FecCD family ABC transporter permease [Clostridia bacterium]